MGDEVDITIIGAGVVGLAIASEVADGRKSVFVLEKNPSFGMETSSRNSQVIHSGIYYAPGSLKARACVAGNRLLYRLCREHGIGCQKLTKLVVATAAEEVPKLESLLIRGEKNGVGGLSILTRSQLKKIEPNVEGVAALFLPQTGIIDVHGLMKFFLWKSREKGAQVVFRSEVIGITKVPNGYQVLVTSNGDTFSFFTRALVNSAGLAADKIASMAGIDVDTCGYRLHYCKGEYFRVKDRKKGLVSRLIYPVPPDKLAGVGIHVTIDLDGRIRLGPGIEYISRIDYSINDDHRHQFYAGVKSMIPYIELDDLEPEMAGIRPKLQGPGEESRDFLITDESDKGLPNFINLIGIESPGLTSSPAIAEMVKDVLDKQL